MNAPHLDAVRDVSEITPEMIEAGIYAYAGYFPALINGEKDAPALMVRDVMRAMVQARARLAQKE
jgi:hypothetical protein